jgi:hypothetical protein
MCEAKMSSSNVRFLRPADTENKTEDKYVQTEQADAQKSEPQVMDVKRNKFLAQNAGNQSGQSKGGFPLSDHVPMRQAMILVVATAAIGIAVGMLIPALSNSGGEDMVPSTEEITQTSVPEAVTTGSLQATEQTSAYSEISNQNSSVSELALPERQPVELNRIPTNTTSVETNVPQAPILESTRQSITGITAPYDNDLTEAAQSPSRTDLQVRIEETAERPEPVLSEQTAATEQNSSIQPVETEAATRAAAASSNGSLQQAQGTETSAPSEAEIAALPAPVIAKDSTYSSDPVVEKEGMSPIQPLDEAELERVLRLIDRGDDHFDRGDILTARRFYELAARANLPEAYDAIGRTYDPIILRTLPVLGLAGDSQKAREFYEMAQTMRDRITVYRKSQ